MLRKRALISAVLALMLLLLSACSPSQVPAAQSAPTCTLTAAPQPDLTAEKELLLENWKTLLNSNEVLQTHMLWVLDYLDAFHADNRWDSLLKARAACCAAKTAFESAKLPSFSLTDEQYDALQAADIDAEMVKTEYLSLEQTLTTDRNTLQALHLMLHEDVFYTAVAADLDIWSGVIRGYLADTAEYLCCATNYLLLQLDMPEAWEDMQEAYPLLFGTHPAWIEDENAIMEATTDILDRYEARFVEMNAFQGRSEYALLLVKEAVETLDVEILSKELHTVDGTPRYLLTPDWLLSEADYVYAGENAAAGEVELVQSGEEITVAPTICYVTCEGVSWEEVAQYGQQMTDLGYAIHVDEETHQVFIMEGDTTILIEWAEDSTIFYMTGELACLATELHLLARLSQ